MTTTETTLNTRRATREFARAFATTLRAGDLVYLEGPLGAGKTFIARGMLRSLGLPARVPVTSPTFSLIVEYAELSPAVIHADLYRLEDEAMIADTGLVDLVRARSSIVLVEWGLRFARVLGSGRVLTLECQGDSRTVRESAVATRG